MSGLNACLPGSRRIAISAPARLARSNRPVRELPARGNAPIFGKASADARFGRKVVMKVTADHPDRDEESVADVDELLVEEVSVDGMCGVY